MQNNLVKRYGTWGLVTGAARAAGLGYAFARFLAAHKMNLILVDILDDQLRDRAAELEAEFGIEAKPIALDLGRPNFLETLRAQTDSLDVGLLVCNHMFTPKDTPLILDMSLDMHHKMIDINARAYTTLIHAYGNLMRDRGKGAIIVVSSGAGVVTTPYTGAYAANKSFQIALGEAAWYELQGTGVDVVVLAAGLMNTQGDALADYPQYMVSEVKTVVEEVFAKLGKQMLVIPGRVNKLFLFMQTKLMSRQRAVSSIGQFMENGLNKTQ